MAGVFVSPEVDTECNFSAFQPARGDGQGRDLGQHRLHEPRLPPEVSPDVLQQPVRLSPDWLWSPPAPLHWGSEHWAWRHSHLDMYTGCFYELSPINLVRGPLKCSKSNFNPVHVFLHFKSLCLVVLKLILTSKLSELEQFENLAENGLFMNKIAFSGKWLRPRAKCKKGDPI